MPPKTGYSHRQNVKESCHVHLIQNKISMVAMRATFFVECGNGSDNILRVACLSLCDDIVLRLKPKRDGAGVWKQN